MRKICRPFFALLAVCLFTVLIPWSGFGAEVPFRSGEKLTFVVTWGAIPVGEGVLEVLPHTVVNGEAARRFSMTARTNTFADIFYKVRDRMEGYTDMAMTQSLHYTKLSEGRNKRNVAVPFDWNEERARYLHNGEQHASVDILPGSFDPLSMFFVFRLFDLEVGKKLEVPVADGKRVIQGHAVVLDREDIHVRGVDYDTFLVRVDMGDVDGVFMKSRDADLFIWVTADDRRMPVRMKSSVVVGNFMVELDRAEHID